MIFYISLRNGLNWIVACLEFVCLGFYTVESLFCKENAAEIYNSRETSGALQSKK